MPSEKAGVTDPALTLPPAPKQQGEGGAAGPRHLSRGAHLPTPQRQQDAPGPSPLREKAEGRGGPLLQAASRGWECGEEGGPGGGGGAAAAIKAQPGRPRPPARDAHVRVRSHRGSPETHGVPPGRAAVAAACVARDGADGGRRPHVLRNAAPGAARRYLYPEVSPLSEDEDRGSESSGSDEKPCCVHAARWWPPGRLRRRGRGRRAGGQWPGAREAAGLAQPRQRHTVNARERDRTNSCVNTAPPRMPRSSPLSPLDCKFPKIETLRLASSYISYLGNVLLVGRRACGDGQLLPLGPAFFHARVPAAPSPPPPARDGENAQPKQICTFCLSNQRKLVSVARGVSTSGRLGGWGVPTSKPPLQPTPAGQRGQARSRQNSQQHL